MFRRRRKRFIIMKSNQLFQQGCPDNFNPSSVSTFDIAEFDIGIVHSCKKLLRFIRKQEAGSDEKEEEDKNDELDE